MIQTYAQKLLSPYVGLVQVARIGEARALSLDGRNWAIEYSLAGLEQFRKRDTAIDPNLQFALVATIEAGCLQRRALHPFLEPADVRLTVDSLFDAVSAARLPFATTDRYEYWLLDSSDDRPLALVHSCINEEDTARPPPCPAWVAIPAAQLDVPPPEQRTDGYVPPVNYRLQKLVEERAGVKPRGAWFEGPAQATDDFPPCLIREDWDDENKRRLCALYIQRLAPRLLMLPGLSRPVRHRLEQAARDHVFDVERFYPLYPEVIDQSLLTAARVEARLRRTAGE